MNNSKKILVGVVLVLVVLFLFNNQSVNREFGLPYEEYYMNEQGELVVFTVYPDGFMSRQSDVDDLLSFDNTVEVGDEVTIFYGGDFETQPRISLLNRLLNALGLQSFRHGAQFASADAVSSGRFKVTHSSTGRTYLENGAMENGVSPTVGVVGCKTGEYINMFQIEKVWGRWVRTKDMFEQLYRKKSAFDGIPTEHTWIKTRSFTGWYGFECLEPLFFEEFAYSCKSLVASAYIDIFEVPYSFTGPTPFISCPSGACKHTGVFAPVIRSPTQKSNAELISELCANDNCGVINTGSWVSTNTPSGANANWQSRSVTGYTAAPECAPINRNDIRTVCLSGYYYPGSSQTLIIVEGRHVHCVADEVCPPDKSKISLHKRISGGRINKIETLICGEVVPEKTTYRTICESGYHITGQSYGTMDLSGVRTCSKIPVDPQDECDKEPYYEHDEEDKGNKVVRVTREYGVNDNCEFVLISTNYRTTCKIGYHIEGEATNILEKQGDSEFECVPVQGEEINVYVVNDDASNCNEITIREGEFVEGTHFTSRANCLNSLETHVHGFIIVTPKSGDSRDRFCAASSYLSTDSRPSGFFDSRLACLNALCSETPMPYVCEDENGDDEDGVNWLSIVLVILLLGIIVYFANEKNLLGKNKKRAKKKRRRGRK